MDERKKCTLIYMAHCILQDKDLLTKFWANVVYYANYLLNLVLTHAVNSMTPIDKWCVKKPSSGHLKIF